MPEALSQALAVPGLGWLTLAVLVAGLVRGFSGFGSAMIIMPVASSVLSPFGAIAFLIVVELFGPLPNLPDALRNGDRRDVARLMLGAVLGLPLGLLGLSTLSPVLFGWGVSIIVIVLLILLMAGWRYQGVIGPGMIIGVGGFLSGLAGLAGPPVIMVYMASRRPIAVIRANFLLYLLCIDILMLVAFGLLGELHLDLVLVGVLLIVPYVLANMAGARLFRPEAERAFRTVAYVIIAASALLGLPIWM